VPLVFSLSGDALFFQAMNTKGQLFVSAFGFDRRETNWAVHPTFIPFLDLCLQNARGRGGMPTTFEPGEMFVQKLPDDKTVRQFMVRDGDREIRRGSAENGRIEFPMPDRPGLYSLSFDGESSAPLMLSVNPSPLESELTYLTNLEGVQAQLTRPSLAPVKPAPARVAVELARSQVLRQHLWWVFLLAGLALVFAETIWVAARRV